MKLVILESPYAGDVERNVEYAKRCALDCLNRGESPMVPHLLYTQMLDDTKPDERKLGIAAGLAWRAVADYSIFYVDYGWTPGMAAARDSRAHGAAVIRTIGKNRAPTLERRDATARALDGYQPVNSTNDPGDPPGSE